MFAHHRWAGSQVGTPMHVFLASIVVVALGWLLGTGAVLAWAADDAPDAAEAVVAAEAATEEADEGVGRSCGLAFDLPADATLGTRGKDRAWWTVEYDDGGELAIVVQALSWNDEDDTLADFSVEAMRQYADEMGYVIDEGGWTVYGDVRAYACGCVGTDGIMLSAVTSVMEGQASQLLLAYDGPDVKGVSSGDMASILRSLATYDDPYMGEVKRGRLMYYDLLDVVDLEGSQILEVVEDGWQFAFVSDGDAPCWVGRQSGPLDAVGCLVAFVTVGDGEGSADGSPFASRDDLLGGVQLSGMQVQWVGVPPIEWDEPSDAGRTLQTSCGLTDMLEDGYTDGWDDDGAFSWMRVGSCTIDGQDAYWAIEIVSPGSGQTCTATVSVDLLRNGHGGGFDSYDELVQTVFGPLE